MKATKIFLSLLALTTMSTFAQNYKSQTISEAETYQNGVYYSVAQTEIVFNVKVEKTTTTKGVYRESAYLLGIDNANLNNGESYKIKSITMCPKGVANENYQYFLTYNANTKVELFENGTIKSIYTDKQDDLATQWQPKRDFRHRSMQPKVENKDCSGVTPVFEQELLKQGYLTKHPFLTAQQAVAEIKRLREQQTKILSGEVEGTYLNTTVDFMYKQLDAMINGYIALFTGTQTVTEEEYTFSIIPQKPIIVEEDLLVPICKFSKENGVTFLNAKNDDIKLLARIHSFNTVKELENKVNEKKNSKEFKNRIAKTKTGIGIYYAVPEQVEVFVEYGNEILGNKVMKLAQYGFVTSLVGGNKQIELDATTGAIIKIW